MNREEVIANLIKFASMAYRKPAAELSADTNLNELGVQSSQRVAMSASIEDEYDVTIPVAKFGQFETINALADYIIEEADE